jgi:hypothetical protein
VFDAATKIPDGLLYGNIVQLGNFDECLEVAPPNNEFTGRWCRVVLSDVTPLSTHVETAREFMLLPLKHALINATNSDLISSVCIQQRDNKQLTFRN